MIYEVGSDGWLDLGRGRKVRCALGRSGVAPAAAKREGDGKTPLGEWPLRRVLYRADHGGAPQTALETHTIMPDDGWCDAPDDPSYNRPIRLPYPASAERLWRDDRLYDLVVVLGHNDDPVTPGRGSAIFLHLASHDYRTTEGCMAIRRPDLEALLRSAKPGDALRIVAA
ncbi:MAG TPA: L,D-transpeptidase family protein [Caulobacteraceae bacterium]|nr:L,D-transpeptidase family protein [Caulobacteraceae bacterium]